MKLRNLSLAVSLLSVLAMSALAGETSGPPCSPGETSTPPCALAQFPETTVPGEMNSPPATSTSAESSIAEVAIELLEGVLLLF